MTAHRRQQLRSRRVTAVAVSILAAIGISLIPGPLYAFVTQWSVERDGTWIQTTGIDVGQALQDLVPSERPGDGRLAAFVRHGQCYVGGNDVRVDVVVECGAKVEVRAVPSRASIKDGPVGDGFEVTVTSDDQNDGKPFTWRSWEVAQ